MMSSEMYHEYNKESTDFYKNILNQMINAVALHKIVLDGDGKPCDYQFHEINPSFEKLTGLTRDQIIQRNVSDVLPGIKEDTTDWIGIYGNVALNGEPISFESFSAPLGKWYTINAYSPEKNYFITVFNDITPLKSSERYLQEKNEELLKAHNHLKYQASHDLLTGLPNRVELYHDMEMEMEMVKSSGIKRAIFFIDFDNFKFIDSTLGHLFGEKFIVELAARLKSLFHQDCRIYRMDGAEFILVINNFTSPDELKEHAQRIEQSFAAPVILEGNRLHTTVSIGISIYPVHGESIEELIKNANISMINARAIGKNKFAFYRNEMYIAVNQRLMMEKYLHAALENHEFEIHYQPQMDVATNSICGFEALLRWNNPQLGAVSPSVFISIAEQTHLIIPIGKWVFRNACYFIKKLQSKGYTDFTVAVNVSVIQLLQDDFVDDIFKVIEVIDLNPAYLELEITESVFVESYESIFQKLAYLRERGIKIALDDFGKGYSSLSELQNLPIDILKVDKVFIDSIGQAGQICIADMIIMLGIKMNKIVLAEGVESQEQMEYLIKNHCHRVQGFLFSKPKPEKEALSLFGRKADAKAYKAEFKWKNEYSVNIDIIDAQHQKMFAIGNKLSEMVFSEQINSEKMLAIMQELNDYIQYHFKFEENFMKKNRYKYSESHMNEHKYFIEKVNKAQEEISTHFEKDYLMFLIDMVAVWITNHILKEDMKLKKLSIDQTKAEQKNEQGTH